MRRKHRIGTHETFAGHAPVRAGSDRTFGLVFAAVFALIAILPMLHGRAPHVWALVIGMAFLATALTRPALLHPLNRLWFRFGILLHRLVTPVVLGVLFYLVLTPTAAVMRVFGKDPLQRRFDPEAESYWIRREPPGPAPESMVDQF